MSADPEPALSLPLCEWATCDDTYAEPGSLYCKPHGRQARLEGAPWRRPGAIADAPPTPRSDEQPEHGPSPLPEPALEGRRGSIRVDFSGKPLPLTDAVTGNETAPRSHVGVTEGGELFTRPAPAPRKPSAPPPPPRDERVLCRHCTEPALAKTLSTRPNRWSNLCEAHYTEARRNALGSRRREQLEAVLPALGNENGNNPTPEIRPELRAPRGGIDYSQPPIPTAYTERAARLADIGAEIDELVAELQQAKARWAEALEALR